MTPTSVSRARKRSAWNKRRPSYPAAATAVEARLAGLQSEAAVADSRLAELSKPTAQEPTLRQITTWSQQ